jgi:hypothetical protein
VVIAPVKPAATPKKVKLVAPKATVPAKTVDPVKPVVPVKTDKLVPEEDDGLL